MNEGSLRALELSGGRVEVGPVYRFRLPGGATGYADAQIDDYGAPGGRFRWRPGATLSFPPASASAKYSTMAPLSA